MFQRRIRQQRRHRAPLRAAAASFEPLEPRTLLSTVLWTGGGNGATWEDPNNWSTHALPGSTADVVIDVAANPAITLSSAAASIHSLTLAEALTVTGGSLAVATTATITGTLTINGGTVTGGAWDSTGGTFQAGASTASTLSGVSLSGDLVLPGGANLRIASGITLAPTARIRLTGAATNNLGFVGSTTLASGMISLENSAGLAFVGCVGTGTLTIGPAAAISGGRAVLGQNVFSAGNAGLINQGTISATGAITMNASGSATFANPGTLESTGSGVLSVAAGTWSSAGTIRAATSGTVTLSGAWSSTGHLVCDDGTLNLGGTISPASLSGLMRTGGQVNLTGTLNNAGATLTLDDTSGSWTLNGGTIMGGTVALTQSATLLFTTNNASTLSGVTLSGELVLAAGNALRISSGLTFTAGSSVHLTGDGATLGFAGAQTISAPAAGAEFVFEIPTSATGTIGFVTAGAVTISSSIRIHGANGTIGGAVFGGAAGSLINQGVISADTPGSPLTLRGTLTNSGTFEAVSGASLLILSGAALSNYATSTLTGGTWRVLDGSTLSFGPGAITINAATIYLAGASTFAALSGLATNRGTLTLADGRGFTFAPVGNTFTNAATGTLIKSGAGDLALPASLHLDSPGAVVAAGGTLSIIGPLVQHTGGSLTGGTWKALDGGTLLFPGPVTTNSGTIVLAGSGSMPDTAQLGTNSGSITLADGHGFTFAPPGAVFVNAAGATLAKTGTGQTTIAASLLFNNQGTVRVSGGTLAIDLCAQLSGSALTGGSWAIDGGTLDMAATLLTSAASVSFTSAGGEFPAFDTVQTSSGTITVSSGGALTLASLTNTGTLVLNTGGTLTITGAMNQNGSANIAGGVLHAGAGGASTGVFVLSASGSVRFEGDQTLAQSAAFTGASGTVSFVSGTVDSSASFAMGATLALRGGVLAQSRALALTGPLSISSGTLFLNAASTIPTLQLSGGVLDGSGDLTISGAFPWTGGIMAGSGRTIVGAAGSATISGPAFRLLSRRLELACPTVWSSGSLLIDHGTLTNRAGATFTISAPVRLLGSPTGAFNNLGTLVKSGTTYARIDAILNNSGTVRIANGSLALLGGGVHTGAFIVNAGARLRMAGQNIAQAAATFTGAGIFDLSGGSLLALGGYSITGSTGIAGQATFKGVFAAGSVKIKNGVLDLGSNSTATSVFNSGTLRLNASTLALTGSFTQTSSGTLTVQINSLGATARYGHITAAALSLSGALQVSFAHVYPDDGAQFNFLTGTSRTGTFQSASAASLGPNRAFLFTYTPTVARMTVRARIFDG